MLLPIHLQLAHIVAEPKRRVLRVVRAYAFKAWERFLRVRSPITDLLSYLWRADNLTRAMNEIVGAAYFSQAPDIPSEVVWEAVDQLARRQDGQYARRAGHLPRLGIFGDAFIGYQELDENQKVEIIHELSRTIVEKYGCAVEAVYHSRDGISIDHFHMVITDRKVTPDGVQEKIRAMNGVFSKIAGDPTIEGGKKYAEFPEFVRSNFATLLSEATGLPFIGSSYARNGLDIEPVPYVSKARVALERRQGRELWREDREARLASRPMAHAQSLALNEAHSKALSRDSIEMISAEILDLSQETLDLVSGISSHLNPIMSLSLAAAILQEDEARETLSIVAAAPQFCAAEIPAAVEKMMDKSLPSSIFGIDFFSNLLIEPDDASKPVKNDFSPSLAIQTQAASPVSLVSTKPAATEMPDPHEGKQGVISELGEVPLGRQRDTDRSAMANYEAKPEPPPRRQQLPLQYSMLEEGRQSAPLDTYAALKFSKSRSSVRQDPKVFSESRVAERLVEKASGSNMLPSKAERPIRPNDRKDARRAETGINLDAKKRPHETIGNHAREALPITKVIVVAAPEPGAEPFPPKQPKPNNADTLGISPNHEGRGRELSATNAPLQPKAVAEPPPVANKKSVGASTIPRHRFDADEDEEVINKRRLKKLRDRRQGFDDTGR